MATVPRESGWIDSRGLIKLQDGRFTVIFTNDEKIVAEFERDMTETIIVANIRCDNTDFGPGSVASIGVCVATQDPTQVLFQKRQPAHGINFVVFDIV